MRGFHRTVLAVSLVGTIAGCSSSSVNDTSATGGTSGAGATGGTSGAGATGGSAGSGASGGRGGQTTIDGGPTGGSGGVDAGPSCLPVTNLLAHFRADDLPLANDAAVMEWPDAAGSHSIEALDGTEAPKFVNDSPDWNGHAVVRFDGMGDRLTGKLPLLELGGGNPSVTFIVVARASNVDVSRSVIAWGDPTAATAGLHLIFTPLAGWRFGSYGLPENLTGPAPGSLSTLPALIAGTKSVNNYYVYVNGENVGSTVNADPIDQLVDVLSLGAAVCASTCPEPWQGDVAEVAVYKPLSDAVRKQAEACLSERYALSTSDAD